MAGKMFTGFLVTLLAAFILGTVLASSAGTTPDAEPRQSSAAARPTGQGEDAGLLIYLANETFDPLVGLPGMPESLSFSEEEALLDGSFIVQFSGPVLSEWKQALVDAGGVPGDYLPDYAFLVYLDAAAKTKVESLPFVRWVGAFQPAYRISRVDDYTEERSYRVMLAPWANPEEVQKSLEALAAGRLDRGEDALYAVLNGSQLALVARVAGVQWIEPIHMQQLYNDIGGGTIMGGATAWGNGYTGAGITIGVADSGLDTGSAATIHQDFSGRVAQISSWPVQYVNYGGGCETTNTGANDGPSDTQSGHGTHVTGSVAGNGARSSGQIKGLAHAASITFQAIEQYTTWGAGCSLPNGYYLTGIPNDTRQLLNEAHGWGARVHNNSWGGGFFGVYDSQSRYFDEFISQHADFSVAVAAGNSGVDGDANGYVDQNSISSPATAKNVISVGAADNERGSGGIAGWTWGDFSASKYPAAPTSSDYVSDSRQELAAFSSRGPMADGRIKPDLVAPGTNILSVRSSLASGSGWGVYNSYYMYNGGTSMASPLVAGAAALVRDYYIDSEGHANPSAALVKATLINSAVDTSGYGNSSQEAGQPIPNNHEGWGLVNVAAATTPGSRLFADTSPGVSTGGVQTIMYSVSSGKPFKVTLVWSDAPGSTIASKALVNDLNLRVTAPNGTTTYWGNRFSGGWSQSGGAADTTNNVENVYIQSPSAGTWKVEIIGQNVPQGPQPYALVVDGNVSTSLAISVTSIDPVNAPNNAILTGAVIHGTGFEASSTVQLKRGATTIPGSGVSVNVPAGTITANFNLNGAVPGLYDVEATNSSNNATLANAFSVLDSSLPDLVITKTAGVSNVVAGKWLTYTIAIENSRFVTATGVVFTDTLPAGVVFSSLTPACAGGVTLLPGGFACQVQPATLTVGMQVTYTLVVWLPVNASGTLLNRVDVSNQEGDAYPPDNSSGASVVTRSYDIFMPMVTRNWSLPVASQAIRNGGFENGQDGSWTEYSSNDFDLIVDTYSPNQVLPHSGNWGAWLGGDYYEESTLTQQVSVQPGKTTLNYWYRIASTDVCGFDTFYVKLNGVAVQTTDLCQSTNTGAWVLGTLSLSSYAGQSVSLQFQVITDGSLNSNLFLDDVSLD